MPCEMVFEIVLNRLCWRMVSLPFLAVHFSREDWDLLASSTQICPLGERHSLIAKAWGRSQSLTQSRQLGAEHSLNQFSSIKLTSLVISFGGNPLTDCDHMREIDVSENPNFIFEDGVVMDRERTQIICCNPSKSGAYSISNTVTVISEDAFWNCRTLKSVTISNSATSVGWGAFAILLSWLHRDSKLDYFHRRSAFSGCIGWNLRQNSAQSLR